MNASQKKQVKKIIIGASYTPVQDFEESDERILEKAEKYKKLGRSVHKIERFKENGVDNLKFLYSLHGVPLISFSLINAVNSSAEEIFLVGSREVEKVYNTFIQEFPQQRERVRFVSEGNYEKLSLSNSLKRAYQSFSEKENELVLWLPGDLPILTGLESLLEDKDAALYDTVLDFNARENLFSDSEGEAVFSRTFHHTLLDYKGRNIHVKEPNPYLLNLHLIDSKKLWPVFDVFYGSRRGGGVNAFTILSAFFPSRLVNLAKASFIFLQQLKNIKERKINFESLEEIADLVLDMRVKLKAENDDLRSLPDLDSYEDHEFYESLFDYASCNGKLNEIYPHAEMLHAFRESAVKMNLGISHSYLNHRREKLKLAPLYDREGNLINSGNAHAEKAYKILTNSAN